MTALAKKLTGYTGNDEQRTPGYIYDWLNRRFQFTFDAAASHENAKCDTYGTERGTFFRGPNLDRQAIIPISPSTALAYPWRNHRVFVNPPYSRPLMGQFIEKAIAERDNADIIVMLVKCDTSTKNYRMLAAHSHIEYLGRVRYESADGKPQPAATFASCIAILRPTEPTAGVIKR